MASSSRSSPDPRNVIPDHESTDQALEHELAKIINEIYCDDAAGAGLSISAGDVYRDACNWLGRAISLLDEDRRYRLINTLRGYVSPGNHGQLRSALWKIFDEINVGILYWDFVTNFMPEYVRGPSR
ncbi:MAG: hypothetical protein Q9220_000767 [cf. Caloplaca sp. 1 TL-2023]